MNEIIIRTVNQDDLPVLLRFEQGIIATERPYDPTLKDDPINYYDLKELIESEEATVIVAEAGAELIGSGYALIKQSKPYERHGKYAYLGFMFVAEAFRGKGVNKMIVAALQQWALTKAIREIRLEVYSENSNAIRAYEKVGFRPHMLEMRIQL